MRGVDNRPSCNCIGGFVGSGLCRRRRFTGAAGASGGPGQRRAGGAKLDRHRRDRRPGRSSLAGRLGQQTRRDRISAVFRPQGRLAAGLPGRGTASASASSIRKRSRSARLLNSSGSARRPTCGAERARRRQLCGEGRRVCRILARAVAAGCVAKPAKALAARPASPAICFSMRSFPPDSGPYPPGHE